VPLAIASAHDIRFERKLGAGILIDRPSSDLLKPSSGPSNGRGFGKRTFSVKECAIWSVINQRTKLVSCWIRPFMKVSLQITFHLMDNFYHACKSVATATATLNILDQMRNRTR
jgi:hypothetical protein